MAAITGFPASRMRVWTSRHSARSAAAGVLNCRMPAPPQNILPAPMMTMARTSGEEMPNSRPRNRPARTVLPRPFTGALSMVRTTTPSTVLSFTVSDGASWEVMALMASVVGGRGCGRAGDALEVEQLVAEAVLDGKQALDAAADGQFVRHAHATMQVDALQADEPSADDAAHLGRGDQMPAPLCIDLVEFGGERPCQRARLLKRDKHVHQPVLHGLERPDGCPELPALACVAYGVVEKPGLDAHRFCADGQLGQVLGRRHRLERRGAGLAKLL